MQCRDALSKALYSKLFDYIVKGVNIALKLKDTGMQTMQVSVLDIFGFEVSFSPTPGSVAKITVDPDILSHISPFFLGIAGLPAEPL